MSAKHPKSASSDKPELPGIPNHPFPLKRVIGGLLAVALAFAAAALLTPKSAQAKDTVGLSQSETAEVKRIEAYLNAITTMTSRFMQVTDQGHFAQGQFIMHRPGRMRIDYDDPTPVLIVSDGTWVMYKDEELDQLSHMPLSQMPASMFIDANIDLFGETLLITGYEAANQVVRVTLRRADDPMDGALTLVFAQQPLKLKKWSVVDAQGVTTTVSLLGPKFGGKLDGDDLFKVEQRIMESQDD